MFLDLEQNTQEWLDFRKNKIGASDASAIMGSDPHSTPYQKWMEKMDLLPPKVDHWGMQRGRHLEPLARLEAEKQLGCLFSPRVKLHSRHQWMFCSLDGASEDNKTIIEIKCPDKEDHALAESGRVPSNYIAQIQHQLEVCDLEMGYYFSFDGTKGVLVKVFRDDAFIKQMIEKEKQFWESMQDFEPPALSERDYVTHESEEWKTNAQEYIKLMQEIDLLDRRKEILRENLIRQANGQNGQGSGLKVFKRVSKGHVDYKAIPQLKSVDLEKYRKKSTESWTIRVS